MSFYVFKSSHSFQKIIIVNFVIVLISVVGLFFNKDCTKKISDIKFNKLTEKNYLNNPQSAFLIPSGANVPITEADVRFSPVADGGLMILPNRQIKRYAYGHNEIDVEAMQEEPIYDHLYAFDKDGNMFKAYIVSNTTSTIYERSIIVTLDTLKSKFLGWGFSNNDIGTIDYLERNDLDKKNHLTVLNLKDASGNLFKISNEFGFLILIIFYYFLKYVMKDNKIRPDKIFFMSLFIIQMCRGAGYLNGGFCIVLFEILFYQKFIKK